MKNTNRIHLVKVADDTINIGECGKYTNLCWEEVSIEEALDQAVTGTEIIGPEDDFDLGNITKENDSSPVKFQMMEATTTLAARNLVEQGYKDVAVLNFASATSPGGAFLGGASTQEEELCRMSGLYFCLSTNQALEGYYGLNKKFSSRFYTHAMIYSPEVPFFKDENYMVLDQPYLVSVITAPAPNLYNFKPPKKELQKVLEERIDRILSALVCFEHRNVVLGAWGCGAFHNNPEMIAKLFKQALDNEKFKLCFDNVIFAIPDKEGANYKAFEKVFQE